MTKESWKLRCSVILHFRILMTSCENQELKLCVITFFTTFFEKRENLGWSNDAKRSKTGNSLRGQKKIRHAIKRGPWTNK